MNLLRLRNDQFEVHTLGGLAIFLKEHEEYIAN